MNHATGPNTGETLPRFVGGRLSPPRRGMGCCRELERMPGLRPLRQGLASFLRFRQRTSVFEAALQAGHSFERGQRELCPSNEKLSVDFDAVYTAEDIGSYKPSDRNFDYMLAKLETLGIQKHEILHTAESMFHDHGPANQHGLASCWIYRRHDQEGFGATMDPGRMPKYDFRFNNMADLAKAHQEESEELV